MSVTLLDGLPGFSDSDFALKMRVRGPSAFVRSPHFIARINLESGNVEWLIERSLERLTKLTLDLPRRIQSSGSDLWVDEAAQSVAELILSECGGLKIFVRNAETGSQIWEHFIPIPEAADWAEPAPACPGARTEEIEAFIANDPKRLIVCLFRQSRRTRHFGPTYEVSTMPPYACQTDATRFDPRTGKVIWETDFPNVRIGILERESYVGIWSHSPRLGIIDFETGTNLTLYESPNELGWPVRVGSDLAVSWHNKREVGVDWIDERGNQLQTGLFRQSGVRSTSLHSTESGLALQTNEQTLWWLGNDELPLWNIRAKPYIYRVYRFADTDVFVGTDGRGGRLLGFDAASGQETLNLKPPFGGAGTLSKIPGHDILVAKFWISRTDATAGRLLILSTKDHNHALGCECRQLFGVWEHGAVCRAGVNGERLAIVDIRP